MSLSDTPIQSVTGVVVNVLTTPVMGPVRRPGPYILRFENTGGQPLTDVEVSYSLDAAAGSWVSDPVPVLDLNLPLAAGAVGHGRVTGERPLYFRVTAAATGGATTLDVEVWYPAGYDPAGLLHR